MNPRLTFMLDIIQKMGDFQRKHFRTEIEFETKAGPMDTVSFVDKECEQMFYEAVNREFPGDAIMGEETYNPSHSYEQHKRLWIVDPLDGTLMYKKGVPFYAPMIAYVENGTIKLSTIFFPELNTIYYADDTGAYKNNQKIHTSEVRNMQDSIFNISLKQIIKNIGSEKLNNIVLKTGKIVDAGISGHKFQMCIEGITEGGVSFDGGSWDTVPTGFLIQQAGGKVTNFGSDSWDIFNPKVIFSNGLIHAEFQKLLES